MSTRSVATLNEEAVLAALYGAVGDEARWVGVLSCLAEYVGAHAAMLRVADRRQCAHSFFRSSGLPDMVARAYADYWWQHDPWMRATVASGGFRQGMVGRGSGLVAQTQLRQGSFYKDFLMRVPAEYLLLCIMNDQGGGMVAPPASLSLLRVPGAADFSDAEVERLRKLAPHLQRAFTLHWQWRNSQAQLWVFQNSLDGLDFGVLFFDASGRMLSVNAAAKEIIADADYSKFFSPLPVALPCGGPLDSLMQATANGEGGPLTVRGAHSKHLLAFALPIAHEPAGVAGNPNGGARLARNAVMLMLIDQQKQPGAAIDFMVRSFKLSPAESRILPLLFDNHTPAEMADILGLKISTIRSQLSSVYAKTGTTRQQELILLLGAAPPVRRQGARTHP